jgi:hypothetical protein
LSPDIAEKVLSKEPIPIVDGLAAAPEEGLAAPEEGLATGDPVGWADEGGEVDAEPELHAARANAPAIAAVRIFIAG